MAINLASNFVTPVQEAFSMGSFTEAAFNGDYSFEGTKGVKIYTVNTVDMVDYVRTGSNRYGTPTELSDTVQELLMTRDRAFSFTIDEGNDKDQLNIKGAATALARQLRDKVIPEIDTYRLAKFAAGVSAEGTNTTTATKDNAYDLLLAAQEFMFDNMVPVSGRICYVSGAFYRAIKQDDNFIRGGDSSQMLKITGAIGEVDGVTLVPVPKRLLPDKMQFMMIYPDAGVAPVKINNVFIHNNPIGINGNVVEGRFYYDAFVLDTKKNGIYTSYAA